MDIVEFTNKIQELEFKHRFFEFETKDGIRYWDIIRHDIFYRIYYSDLVVRGNLKEKKNYLSYFATKSIELIRFLSYLTTNKNKYMFFSCSRNETENKENVDIILQDVLSILPKNDRVIVETWIDEKNNKYAFDHVFNSGLFFYFFLYRLKNIVVKKVYSDNYKILDILDKEFGFDDERRIIATNLLDTYRIQLAYYKRLFRFVKPRKIFFVQNGIQKALFSAAKSLNIPLIEFQHGLIGYIHPGYSYHQSVKNEQTNVPDIFLTFSPFWTKNINYPVKQIVSIGNSYYSKHVIKEKIKYEITFIFANIYTDVLMSFIDSLISLGYKKNICIKLHPNQFHEYSRIADHYKQFDFIEIVKNELSVSNILSQTRRIFAIQSTCVYEALYNDIGVFIYKVEDYRTHEDIFDNPLVCLVDTVEEFIEFDDEQILNIKEEEIFFEQFNKNIALDILSS